MSSELSDFFKLLAEEKNKKLKLQEEEENFISEIIDADNEIKNLFSTKVTKEVKTEPVAKNNLIERSLGLLAEPSNIKQQNDPLTPLDQKFVTLEELNKHYNLFLNRIQQQLSTLGGGGEYRFRYLDGLVGIKTNSSAYNGKFLQWNSTTNNAEFVNPNAVGITSIVSISGVTTYYQATNNDDYIGISADNPVTIVLPSSPVVGKKITVKDEGNKISTYNITVRAGIGASVENDTSVLMKINHESFTYFYNGYNWYIV